MPTTTTPPPSPIDDAISAIAADLMETLAHLASQVKAAAAGQPVEVTISQSHRIAQSLKILKQLTAPTPAPRNTTRKPAPSISAEPLDHPAPKTTPGVAETTAYTNHDLIDQKTAEPKPANANHQTPKNPTSDYPAQTPPYVQSTAPTPRIPLHQKELPDSHPSRAPPYASAANTNLPTNVDRPNPCSRQSHSRYAAAPAQPVQ